MPSDQFGQIINPLNGYLILIVVALFKNTLYYGLLEKFLFHSLSFRFPDISFEILAMGILSLILSEIFQYGIGLQDEADMTI